MKKFAIIFCVLFIGLGFTVNFAQSNGVKSDANKKTNKRPTPTPTPEESENADESEDDVIRIDTNLVTVPVKVRNRNGGFIGGLKKEDFQVFEDKVEQEIALFSTEQEPFTVALILDMSYSSKFKIDEIQQAALTFITELRPADKVMVISFDGDMHILCEPTNDRKILQGAIVKTRIDSGTSLYDTVDFVVNKRFNKMSGRKAIVLFTDGVDTTSRKSHDRQNIRDVSELDALIFPIHYDTYADVQAIERGDVVITDDRTKTTPPIGGGSIPTGGKKSPFPFPLPTGTIGGSSRGIPTGGGTTREEYRRAEEYLNEMALRTGGRVYEADSASRLARAFTQIAEELREFYSLGYYPKEEGEAGSRRELKVKVNKSGAKVQARDSYIVKAQN
jgi:VWFA-related protein